MEVLTVKTLLGHKNLRFSIDCLKSFVDNSKDQIFLQIFEDGSLKESDRDILKTELGNIAIISKKERDDKLESVLKNYPNCYRYRNDIPYAQKIFDVMLYDNEDLLFIDSDIFFIKKFKFPKFNNIPVFIWDSEHAFSFTPLEFFKIKTSIYPRVNTGLFYFPKSLFSLDFIEKLLEDKIVNKGFERRNPWLEQTVWSFLAAKNKNVNYFDKNEIVMAAKKLEIKDTTIAVHLVSTYRNHFQTLKNNITPGNASTGFKEVRLIKGVKFLNKVQFASQRLLKKTKRVVGIN